MAKLKTGRHTNALKAHRHSERVASRHRHVKRQIRALTREFLDAVGRKESGRAQSVLPKLYSAWDKAAQRGVVHWKSAARKKSRMNQKIQALQPSGASAA